MPRNPAKRPCAFPGCRAWARRGSAWCASHERSRALQGNAELVLPLFRALAKSDTAPPPLDDDLALIEEELKRLFEARERFLAWVIKALEEDGRVTPTQFLRAWNDSTARVIHLLRARRELTGGGSAEDGLFNAVYDALEAMLPKEGAPVEGGTDAQP
ncbi:MAG: hypothetical protein H5T70_04530 [Chloroflexi bacterium]|nr:hypothetical protein [Chloroflexota bacterium]